MGSLKIRRMVVGDVGTIWPAPGELETSCEWPRASERRDEEQGQRESSRRHAGQNEEGVRDRPALADAWRR